jgi:hypothetical protein
VSAFWKVFISITISAWICAPRALCAPVSNMPHPESMSGQYWQRVFDPRHPEAPPQLVLKQNQNPPSPSPEKPRRTVICVRAGDRLVLHQAGGASTLSLAARALESGACGAHIRTRIAVTGVVAEITVAEQGIGILSGREDKWR